MINRSESFVRTSCSRSARASESNCSSCGRDKTSAVEDINVISNTSGCGGNINSTFGLIGYPLASVYAPLQDFDEVYDCETGLTRGTIFPALDLPFVCGGMNGGVGRG